MYVYMYVGDCYDLVPIGAGPHCISEQMVAAGREIIIEHTDSPEEMIDPHDYEAQQKKLIRDRQEKEREAIEAKKEDEARSLGGGVIGRLHLHRAFDCSTRILGEA